MSKVAVVYWSGTGNTEQMASYIVEGAKNKGADVSEFRADEFSASDIGGYDAIAFGCPSMGAETLEENEFEPMFQSCEPKLKDKHIALFGSYGWGDGEWMKKWERTCEKDGASLMYDSVICNDAPNQQVVNSLREMGRILAS